MKKLIIWIGALVIGAFLGSLNIAQLNSVADFVATIYTRLFQFLTLPTIVLAIITTLSKIGKEKELGRIFTKTVVYTFLTTISAAVVGALLFVYINPEPLTDDAQVNTATPVTEKSGYLDHILSIVPNNIVKPFLDGNILSLLIIAFAVGIAISRLKETEGKKALENLFNGLQEVLFKLINWLIRSLPLGIVAFSTQLAGELTSGVMAESLGVYVLMILSANAIQFFVVLPLFLLTRGLNPWHVFREMSPAVIMALFTKSSVATLPVTMESAERRLGVKEKVSRFVLPVCTTINMNGCAAFILITSLFVMNSAGMSLPAATILLWLAISVVSAVGNAGVPMGCYFLTFSLMTGIGAPVAILGLILPIYTVIDMVETAENVWSDSCVCAMTNRDLTVSKKELSADLSEA